MASLWPIRIKLRVPDRLQNISESREFEQRIYLQKVKTTNYSNCFRSYCLQCLDRAECKAGPESPGEWTPRSDLFSEVALNHFYKDK